METMLNILFVDDEVDFLETITKRLTRRGYLVKSALNCEDAIQVLQTGWPDVVVLDVMLPGKDGIQCLGEIKQQWPSVAVLLLTGHASMRIGLQGLELGAADCCLKPVELEELIEKITLANRET